MGLETALAIGLIGSAAGGVAGRALSAGDRQKALEQNQDAIQQWLDVNVPDPATQKVALQKFVQSGEFVPELEKPLKMEQTKFQDIVTDPRLKESQNRALSSLENLGYNGGFDLTDEANLQKGITDTNTAERGSREAILANMAARGMGGSGVELAAQLNNSQASANRVGQQELDTAAARRKRALDSIMGAGSLAGNLRSQDYQQQSDLAKAEDAINQFNTTNAQSVGARNTAAKNQGQIYNLDTKQRVSDNNTNLANQEEMYNKNLTQQQYENELRKAAGTSGQYGQLASTYNNQAQQTQNMFGGIGSGISQAAGSYAGYKGNQDYLNKKGRLDYGDEWDMG